MWNTSIKLELFGSFENFFGITSDIRGIQWVTLQTNIADWIKAGKTPHYSLFSVNVDGIQPTDEGIETSEGLGVADVRLILPKYTANVNYLWTDSDADITTMQKLRTWQLYPFKAWSLWIPDGDPLSAIEFEMSHNALGSVYANPLIDGLPALIPCKCNINTISSTFESRSWRSYTLEFSDIKRRTLNNLISSFGV